LQRSFALLSLLCVGAISIGSAVVMLRFLTGHMLERDAVVTMEFVQSIAELEDPDIDFTRPNLLGDKEKIAEFFAHIATAPDVIRANVYGPDQTIVWSTEKGLVGKRFEDNLNLQRALAGELVYEFVEIDESEKEEHKYFPEDVTSFVENYIPIRNIKRNEIIGVAEIYRAPTVVLDAVVRGRWLIWIIAVGGGLFLYATLFWIVHRASVVMRVQQERLVEAETMAAIGDMASAVAHGIRNPISSIRSSAELALEGISSDMSHEAARDIVLEVDRLDQWIRKLILFTRPEGEVFENVRIEEIVRDCLESFSEAMEKQGVALKVNIPGPVRSVNGDADFLGQVFHGVISNALEAMPNGGELTVAAGNSSDGNYVELAFSDTGEGIPKEQVDQVFKPFFTSKKGGFGLGLLLVKRVVERHDGTIALSSREGQGTTLSLRFPAAAES
jgi:signal transduction histidine kinase